ncbi:ribosomal protein S18-alanine N-acetyltransferase [Halobacillus sp. Marseille-Q1614]|uniref:ribosomal protein S18-alanine N-acetyltransferase n=1 Tax=Halobacillus sp. Marseille-Q1614 TaxID=2709134 RepID=UPI00156FF683|nr:ribosomal protein S18-alanine N-acetyltransferase [Halobacillus sp. Marseille-Q1614]
MAHIRRMTRSDLDQVQRVEQATFSVPWSKETFLNELGDANPYAHYYVIEDENGVFGYCGVWLIIDEAHVTNIAIHPDYRGKGYGDQLFRRSFESAIEMGAIQLSLEVRVSNTAAQHLYRKFGLVPGGIRKNYYTDNGEDALVMWVGLK